MTDRIPDDRMMDAALYGSVYVETLLAKEDGSKLLRALDERIDRAYAGLDLDLAAAVCREAPELLRSDDDAPGLPEDIEAAVRTLRDISRMQTGRELVRIWMDSIDHRGRLIGLGERSVRSEASGWTDRCYKAAMLREANVRG